MAEDFHFGIDVEAQVSNKEEAIQALQQLKTEMEKVGKGVNINLDEKEINQTKVQIKALEKTIEEMGGSSANFKTVFEKNLKSVQNDFNKTTQTVEKTTRSLKEMGSAASSGQGFSNISKTARIATKEIQGTAGQIDKLKENLQQGVGQTLAFTAINGIQEAVTGAVKKVQDLDRIMTDISIVSGKTSGEMQSYREYAGDAADALGKMGSEYLKASLIYEQQGGLAATYAKDLADSTVIAANISRESTDQMSEYLTATINGFDLLKEKGGEAGDYITDVMAKLGAASGSDLGEIATGLTRTANIAKDAGYEFEETASMIATVSEVTRRTPETIGNAFRSMITSFTQLREAGEDEVNKFTSKIEKAFQLGGIEDISMFDNGNLRDARDIFSDIADRWETMTTEQQAVVSEAVAGKYQAETFRAFMNNQERYTELLGDAYNAAGTAAQQQIVYMDSLEAKTNQFKNQWEIIASNLIDSDMFKGILDDATNLLKIVGAQNKGLQTMATLAAPVVGIFGQLFGSRFVGEAVQNKELNDLQAKRLQYAEQLRQEGSKTSENLADQITKASSLENIMKNLGKDAGKNFEELVNEADKLDEKIKELSMSDEEFAAKAKNDAYKLRTSGGVDSVNQEDYLKIRQQTEQLNKSQGLDISYEAEEEKVKNLQTYYDNAIASDKKLLSISLDQINLDKAFNSLSEENQQINEGSYQKIKEWFELAEDGYFTEKQKASVYKDITVEAHKIADAVEEEYLANQKIVESKKQQLKDSKSLRESNFEQATVNVLTDKRTQDKSQLGNLQKERDLNTKVQQDMEKAAKKTQLATKATQALSLGYSTLIPIMASVNAVQKKEISTQDAMVSSMQSVGSMLMFAPGLWTKAAGAATLGLSAITSHFDLFKTAAEKAKETNDEMVRSFSSLQESSGSALKTVQDIKDTYERFEGVDASAFLNSSDSSEEDIKSYLDMAEKLAEVRPDLVKYYDDEGRAVLDLSTKYEELNKKQQQAVTDSYGVLEKGRNSFTTEYSATLKDSQDKLNKYSYDVSKIQSKLNKAQKSGAVGDTTKYLKELDEARNKMTEQQKTIKDTQDLINVNIVTPYLKANETLDKINQKSKESGNILKDFSSSFMNEGKISAMLQDGDSSDVDALTKNLEKIYKLYDKVEEKAGRKEANTFLTAIENSSELAKTALNETSKSVDDLLSKMEQRDDNYLGHIAANNAKRLEDSRLTTKEQEKLSDQLEENQKGAADSIGKIAGGMTEAYTGIPMLAEGVGALTSKLPQLDKVRESLAGMFSESDLVQAEDKTLSYADSLDKITDSFQESSKSAEGFNQNLKFLQSQTGALDTLEKLKKEVSETGDNIKDAPSFGKLAELDPATAQNLMDGTASIEESIQSIKDTHSAATLGMMMDNQQFFTAWREENADRVSQSEEMLGIDASNAKTLAEYKTLLETATTTQLRELAEQQLKDSQEKDQLTAESGAKTFGNLASFTDIWGNSQLNWIEKIEAVFLNMWDSIVNAGKTAFSWLGNGALQVFDKITEGMKKISSGKIDWTREDSGKYDVGDGWKSSNKADKFIKEKEQEAAKEKKLREKYINEILSGGMGSMSNFELGNSIGAFKPLDIKQPAKSKNLKNKPTSDGNAKKDKEEDNKKEVENLRLTLNQYYKLEDQLKKLQNAYDSLSKKKDNAFGTKRLNLLGQEQDLLIKQTKVLKEHAAALQQEQQDIRKDLSNHGFKFSKSGEISNLNSRLTALQNNANRKSGTAKEAEIEAVKALQEEASRYSDITYNLIPDKKKAIEEAKNTFSQIAKEKVEYAVTLKIDRYDMQKEILSTINEMQEGFTKLDEKMKYTSDTTLTSLNRIATIQKAIKEVQKNPGLTDADRNEMLQKYQKDLLSAVGEARSSYKEMESLQKEFVTESIDQLKKVSDQYDRIISKSNTMIEKLKELYGNNNSKQVAQLYDTQAKAIDAQVTHLEKGRQTLIKYRDTLDKNSEAWKEANDQIVEMGQNIEDKLIAKMEILQKKFQDFSDSLFDKFNKMFGLWGFDGAVDDFDKLIDKTEEYMDSYEKLTTIGAKIKAINDEIAKTTDPEKAKELADYRDKELVSLMNQDKVSQDEYERALKLYEIKQKELAMEDRANAKRVAQLVRDENGNMSYQYVRQETDDTKDDLEELNKLKEDLYNFDSEKVKDASRKIFEIIQNYQDKLKQLQDKGLSPEEYKKEMDKLLAQTQDEIDAQQSVVDKWMQNVGKDGFSNIIDLFKQGALSGDQLGIDPKIFNGVISGLEDGSLSYQDILQGNYDKFASSLGVSSDKVKEAMEKMMELVLGDNKIITDEMANASNKWTSTAQDNVTQLGKAYKKYMNEANNVLNKYNASTNELNNLLNKTNASSKKVTDSIKKQTTAMINTKRKTDDTSKSVKNLEHKLIGSGNGGLFGSMVKIKNEQNSRLQPSLKTTKKEVDRMRSSVNVAARKYKYMGERAEAARQRVIAYSDKKTKQGVKDLERSGTTAKTNAKSFDTWRNSVNKTNSSVKDLRTSLGNLPGMSKYLPGKISKAASNAASKLTGKKKSYASGGYTGTWNNSSNNKTGMDATLHEKELVLNKTDTSNLLNAVKMQRSLFGRLNAAKQVTKNTVNKVNEKITNNNNESHTVTQPVTIHAEFPNAKSSSEIETAFNNLYGKASTFISKK